MISYQELFRSHSKFINHIPFIKLGEIDNLSELTNEALNFYKNRKPTALMSIHPTDFEYTGVDVLGIYDYAGQDISHIGESYLEEHHNSIVPELNYQKGEQTVQTELGKDLPKISTLISNLMNFPGRVRLSKLQSHKHGGWHSHGYCPLLEITLHIPLVSNTLVQAQVGYCSARNDGHQFQIPKTYHSAHFKPGEIWLLNGMMSHRVINDSDQERVHVWIQSFFLDNYKNIVNPKLMSMLTAAISEYQGPYVEEQFAQNQH